MQIAGRSIGPDRPPYIVAEISSNHGGQLKVALDLIRLAAEAGADAVKFQAYEADTITLPARRPEFFIREGLWQGQYLHDLYKICETPFRWFPELARCADDHGVTWFASVFDRSSVDMLMRLSCPAFKIASFELVDLPLIRHAAATGKPMILSTGMADYDEIDDAINATVSGGKFRAAVVLHCVSGYPTPPGEAGLARLADLRASIGKIPVGISDHTTGIEIPIAATALGACMIEKHFKSRTLRTVDGKFSLAPATFKQMVEGVRIAWAAMAAAPAESEEAQRPLRRSLFAVADIEAGETFTEANVRSVRPGNGLPPKELPNVLGKKAACAIEYGTPLRWELVGDAH